MTQAAEKARAPSAEEQKIIFRRNRNREWKREYRA